VADARTEARAVSRLAQMRRGKRELKDARWPGLDAPLKLRVLTTAEVQECHAAAHVRFDQLKMPLGTLLTAQPYEDELAIQLLHRACRNAEDAELPFAIDADDLRENSTVDERDIVVQMYQDLADEVNPAPDTMDAAELAVIEDAVKKKDRSRLLAFGSCALASYLLSMVNPSST
jgi:hypothetical protein